MARMKLSPPWNTRYSQIAALFKYDPEVHVIFDEDNYEVKLYVDDDDKASALATLLPDEYDFGNVTLKVQVVPANGEEVTLINDGTSLDELFETAFCGNGAFAFAKTVSGVMLLDGITYVVFNKQVVQYYTDNLSDYFGNNMFFGDVKLGFGFHYYLDEDVSLNFGLDASYMFNDDVYEFKETFNFQPHIGIAFNF